MVIFHFCQIVHLSIECNVNSCCLQAIFIVYFPVSHLLINLLTIKTHFCSLKWLVHWISRAVIRILSGIFKLFILIASVNWFYSVNLFSNINFYLLLYNGWNIWIILNNQFINDKLSAINSENAFSIKSILS